MVKRFICLFFSVIVIISSFTSCAFKHKESSDEVQYSNYLQMAEYASDYMPSVDTLGNYSSFDITYKESALLIFETNAVGLFLSYNDSEYNKQCEYIADNYTFFDPEGADLVSDANANVNGYDIRLVDQDYEYETYKMGLLIGKDDKSHKICYLYYYDFDLDELNNLDEYVSSFFDMK